MVLNNFSWLIKSHNLYNFYWSRVAHRIISYLIQIKSKNGQPSFSRHIDRIYPYLSQSLGEWWVQLLLYACIARMILEGCIQAKHKVISFLHVSINPSSFKQTHFYKYGGEFWPSFRYWHTTKRKNVFQKYHISLNGY